VELRATRTSQRSIPTSSPRTSGTPRRRRIPKQASISVSGQVAAQPSKFDSDQEVGDTCEVMNRPRTGRSTAARDSNRDPGESELETVKALVREGLLEAKKHNDKARELGLQIVTLEEEIKSKGSSKFTNPLSNVIMITWFVQQNRVRSEPKSFIGPLAQRLCCSIRNLCLRFVLIVFYATHSVRELECLSP
jgi:hypothetical protein